MLQILEPLLVARGALREQLILLDKRVRDAAKADRVCRRLSSRAVFPLALFRRIRGLVIAKRARSPRMAQNATSDGCSR